ncbi:FCD domain-containing protein [Altererythrobacter salegens]|uniref:FCD domain-containing protein n=1 Tax=Croceibacterium salegens TaxID=1737568 RepID=A0A6I4SUC6_9SPHN|nr:GntR family transcriptional regulator [Croceibacterium salegens]MXO58426.1 FCD domain-containing protein [Croceibacterium salegens]
MENKVTGALPKKGPSGIEIAEWIRMQIRRQRLVPGQRLVEVDIIRQTGGSRFKVREALQRLSAEGLVDIEEYRGASVRDASMEEVRQLYHARGALEGICAADFTRKATPEQKSELSRIAAEMDECVAGAAPEHFARLNAQWHNLIMEAGGNLVIQGIVQRLNTPIHHLVFESFYRGERLRAAVEDHRIIVDAIMAGDCYAAEAAMRKHVINGLKYLSELDRNVHYGDG